MGGAGEDDRAGVRGGGGGLVMNLYGLERGRCARYRSVESARGASQLCARSALPLAISLRPAGLPGPAQLPQPPGDSDVTDAAIMETPLTDYSSERY
ncbi:hypothetical protein EVAR_15086_1 [Eumeta japonica]|uniref:Uncharacterized protein n=1 Tax=Eumeta variegata TaxID=151549 RepID=A0A4C1UJK5_EUMVA|nr:hypothetical protein EVAR_15086_1 [Eumeta japonica]